MDRNIRNERQRHRVRLAKRTRDRLTARSRAAGRTGGLHALQRDDGKSGRTLEAQRRPKRQSLPGPGSERWMALGDFAIWPTWSPSCHAFGFMGSTPNKARHLNWPTRLLLRRMAPFYAGIDISSPILAQPCVGSTAQACGCTFENPLTEFPNENTNVGPSSS